MEVRISVQRQHKRLDRFGRVFKRSLLRVTSNQLKKNLEKFSPKGETNVLATSWESSLDEDIARVYSNAPHVNWVNDGTGVFGKYHHRIVPKNAKFLRYVKNGQVIYRKSVAGQPAKHFQEKSIDAMERQLPAQIDEILIETMNECE